MKHNEIQQRQRHGHLYCASRRVFTSQNRFTLKSPNGFVSSEFRGYQTCGSVAPSQTNAGIKVILANPVMIKACPKGVPNNGDASPEGSAGAKAEWSKESNSESLYPQDVPGTVKSAAFIKKNSK